MLRLSILKERTSHRTGKNSSLDAYSEVTKMAVWWQRLKQDALVDNVKQHRRPDRLALHHMTTMPLTAIITPMSVSVFYVSHPADRCQLIRLQRQFQQRWLRHTTALPWRICLLEYRLCKCHAESAVNAVSPENVLFFHKISDQFFRKNSVIFPLSICVAKCYIWSSVLLTL